jgi:hypothetical protein
MKSLIFATTFLLICHHGVAQMNNNTVMVRVTESYTPSKPPGFTDYVAQIFVSFPDGETKEKKLSAKGIKDFAENTLQIHQALDMFFSNKYELVSEQSSGGDMINSYLWIFREVK